MLSARMKSRLVFQSVLLALCLCFAPVAKLAAAEKSNVKIDYTLSLAGVPVGKINMTARFDGNQYRVIATGRTAGVSRLFSDGKGTFATTGRLRGGKIVPSNFNMDTSDKHLTTKVRMQMGAGSIKRLFAAPPLAKRADRIPVKSKHWRNILDPLSAFMVPLDTDGRIKPRSACNRTVPIFDGWQRFDMRLSYSQERQVKLGGSEGYSGPVVICKARYRPIAGHRPTRPATVFLVNNTDMEIWLAPLPGVPVLAPVSMRLGTKFGALVLKTKMLDARIGAGAIAATD